MGELRGGGDLAIRWEYYIQGEMERGMRFCGWGRECGRDVPAERLYRVVGPLPDFGSIIYKGRRERKLGNSELGG